MAPAADHTDLAGLFLAKAEGERAEADLLDPASAEAGASGPASAAVLLLKGGPSAAATPSAGPLSVAETEAATLALGALGLPAQDVAVVSTRAAGTDAATKAGRARLALAVEACDPAWVIALDPEAACDAALVLGLDALPAGEPRSVDGRVWLAVEGLEASLEDPALKRRVWAQLKTLAVEPPAGSPAPRKA